MHEMVIYGVSFDLVGKQPIVLLKTADGNKFLPIWIGHPEAAAILMKLQGASTPRPMTHDLVTDMQGLLRSGLMAWASGASRRVGFANAREGSRYAYTHKIRSPDRLSGHAVDRMWTVAEAFGVGDLPRTFTVPLSEEAQAWAGEVLRPLARPWLCLGVGSRWETKCWPAEHFAALARQAQQHFGGTVLFVGTADEAHRAQATARMLVGPSLDLTGKTTLPQLAALLARADAMAANDTGPLHLAAALGSPGVALFGPTDPARNGPYGGSLKVLRAPGASTTYQRAASIDDSMKRIPPEAVWDALKTVLGGCLV